MDYGYFEELKKHLEIKKPYLKDFIEKWESLYPVVEILKAKKQGFFLVFRNKRLSSTIDPITEAERVFYGYSSSNKVLFLFGIGNLYLLRQLLKIRNQNQITIIIENSEEVLAYYWKNHPDFHEFLLTPNCHIFTNENLFFLWNYLNSLKIEKLQGHKIFKHLPSIQLDKEFYQTIEEKIYIVFKSNFSSLLTKFEFETLWFRNILSNASFLDATDFRNRLNFYKNELESIPFVIVGAGPSLRYSYKELKLLKRKAFIFTTDTALKPLLKMGIIPDGIHILDAQMHCYFHLRGVPLNEMIVFADLVIHPFLLKSLKPMGWVFSSTMRYNVNYDGKIQTDKTKGINLIEKYYGEIAGIQSGGSVSTSAFEIARYLGTKTIFLLGMDLAWTDRLLYCVDTHHYEKWYAMIHRINSLENIQESIFRKRIKSSVKGIKKKFQHGDHVLNLYRAWFEESFLELKEFDPNFSVYNLTYDGATIENIPTLEYSDLLNLPDIDKSIIEEFKNKVKKDHLFYKPNIEILEMIKKIYKLLYKYKNINDLSKKSELYDKFLDLCLIYPDLDVFIHKVETYIERNKNKLTQERIIELRYKNLIKEFNKLIKHYISFNTSLIHSDVF